MKKCLYLIFLLLAAFCGLWVRMWNLTYGVDSQGLPAGGQTAWTLVILSAVCLLIFLVMAVLTGGKSGQAETMRYGSLGALLSYIASVLFLLTAGGEFWQALRTRAGIGTTLICLLGLVSGFCLLGVTYLRSAGKAPAQPAELIPAVYLVIKLVFDFRGWSTDPMILDYGVALFALIFTDLAFYHSVGFAFSKGKPRRTLFYSMAAVFFSAMAMGDGIIGRNLVTIAEHGGYILWLLPVAACVIGAKDAPMAVSAEVPENGEAK